MVGVKAARAITVCYWWNKGGNKAGLVTAGLDITAGNSTVQGVAIDRFSLAGIRLQTNGGNAIVSNHIASDTTCRGISIDGVPDNRIEGNLISGKTTILPGVAGIGIEISGIPARNNQIIGNRIGTDVTGTASIGNYAGISIRLTEIAPD